MRDLTLFDIYGASDALHRGNFSASELLNAYLNRIEQYDAKINAFVKRLDDRAQRAAKASDGRFSKGEPLSPLEGIPIGLKDNIDVAGVNTTNGMNRLSMAKNNASMVDKLEDAGAVIVGKLNMHEGALGGTTENYHHGRTENPWKIGFSPGGSSGGSGAAVSARFVAGSFGTDTLGSVRLPAAFCGICGLKPSERLICTKGVVPLSFSLDTVGPLTRSVRDLALIMGSVTSAKKASNVFPNSPDNWQYGLNFGASIAGLCIGVPSFVYDVEMSSAVSDIFETCLKKMRDLGCSVEVIDFKDYDPKIMRMNGFLISEVEAAVTFSEEMRNNPKSFSESFYRMLDYGRTVLAERYVTSQREIMKVGWQFRNLFERCNIIVTPSSPQLGISFDSDAPDNQAEFTAVANFSGCPALSLPSAISPEGLPFGLQLIAPYLEDMTLLRIGAFLEAEFDLDLTPPA